MVVRSGPGRGGEALGQRGKDVRGRLPRAGVRKRPGHDHRQAGATSHLRGGELGARLAGGIGRNRRDGRRLRDRFGVPGAVDFGGGHQQEPRRTGPRHRVGQGCRGPRIERPCGSGIAVCDRVRGDGGEVDDGVRNRSERREARDAGRAAQVGRDPAHPAPGGPPRRRWRLPQFGRGDHVVAGRQRGVDQPATDESAGAGDQQPHQRLRSRSRSASTIISTSSSNVTCGLQPSRVRAFDASARSTSTSAGR